MLQTNTQQYWDTSNGEPSHGSSRDTHHDDGNGIRGNSPFANYSLVERVIKNCISHLTITKSRAQSNQLNKVLEEISAIYQNEDYDYIPDVISSNTEQT